ncbi:transglutaminase-like domain-containing protein [Cellulomonas fimi]|nr:transglutaminase-like domain-containing protein [Cellulomonas fimi]
MALQSYFRAATNFTYDTRVAPARSEDAVWDFLQSRRGYCVQFATGMALMARTLDIPARVGVGFLPGDADGDGTYVVTGRKSHAWPELYFADQGWVRFEPTPAIQSGAPPLWSDPFAAIGPGDDVPDEALPSAAAPTGAATTAPVPTGPVVEQETEQSWTRVGVIGGVVLVALLLALPLVRRRTRTRADETPERAWLRARRRLASKGISWSDATTPRDAVLAVQSQVLAASGSELDAAAARALQQLARTVERQRYAPAPEDVATEDLLRWTDEVVDGVTSQLSGAGSGRPTR